MNILGKFNYQNDMKTYPFVEVKYAGDSPVTTDFKYDIINITKIALDEIFAYIDDRVVNNIVFQRYIVSSYGRIFDRSKGIFLNPVINKPETGFYKVKLAYYSNWNEISFKDVYIARAVKLMFDYYPGAEYPKITNIQIVHLNNDHSDNRLSNLQYCIPYIQNIQNNSNIVNCSVNLIDNNFSINDPRQPIRLICSMIQSGCSDAEIAAKMGIDVGIVTDIRYGRSYKAISMEYSITKHIRKKEDLDTIIKICEMLQSGATNMEIAKTLGVSRKIVSAIRTRRNYTFISSEYNW